MTRTQKGKVSPFSLSSNLFFPWRLEEGFFFEEKTLLDKKRWWFCWRGKEHLPRIGIQGGQRFFQTTIFYEGMQVKTELTREKREKSTFQREEGPLGEGFGDPGGLVKFGNLAWRKNLWRGGYSRLQKTVGIHWGGLVKSEFQEPPPPMCSPRRGDNLFPKGGESKSHFRQKAQTINQTFLEKKFLGKDPQEKGGKLKSNQGKKKTKWKIYPGGPPRNGEKLFSRRGEEG